MQRGLEEHLVRLLMQLVEVADEQTQLLEKILERLPVHTYPRPTGATLTVRS